MNIRQLQFFYRAACAGTFSAAAQSERVTVQAISKSMRELEAEVGGPLFERHGTGVELTALGEALLGPAREAVVSFEAAEQAARSLRDAREGRSGLRLALVTPPFSKHEFICGVLSRLISHALGIDARLSVSVGADALAGLRSGTVDALVTVGELSAAQCACERMGSVVPGVFLGRNHPLRKRGPLTFAELAPYPVLYSPEIDDFNDTVLVACRKRGLASPLVTVETNEGVVDLLEQQNGYIMGVNLKALSVKPFATMHDLDPADAPSVPVCLVTLAGQQRPEVDRLRQFMLHESSLLGRLLDAER